MIRYLILAALVFAGTSFDPARAAGLARYELRVMNEASSGIKHVFVADAETGASLGDRLVGRIPPRTSAVIDLSNDEGTCRLKFRAVLYSGAVAKRSFNVCKNETWTIVDGGELDD